MGGRLPQRLACSVLPFGEGRLAVGDVALPVHRPQTRQIESDCYRPCCILTSLDRNVHDRINHLEQFPRVLAVRYDRLFVGQLPSLHCQCCSRALIRCLTLVVLSHWDGPLHV